MQNKARDITRERFYKNCQESQEPVALAPGEHYISSSSASPNFWSVLHQTGGFQTTVACMGQRPLWWWKLDVLHKMFGQNLAVRQQSWVTSLLRLVTGMHQHKEAADPGVSSLLQSWLPASGQTEISVFSSFCSTQQKMGSLSLSVVCKDISGCWISQQGWNDTFKTADTYCNYLGGHKRNILLITKAQ